MPFLPRLAELRRCLLGAAGVLVLATFTPLPLAAAADAAPARVIVTFKPASAMARLQPLTLAGDVGAERAEALGRRTGLALRTEASHPDRHDLQLHELDHPDTLRLRERIVGVTPGVARSALRLPDDGGVLLDLCATSTAPCVIVVEGLTMYLPARPLLRSLRALAALPSPPRLLFTALAPTHRDGTGFAAENGIVRRWLSRQREPFLWRCPQARLHALLRRLGYRIDADWDGAGYGEYAIDAVPRAARFVMPAA